VPAAAQDQDIARLQRALDTADAVLVGAGSGLSTAAGLTYSGERFETLFADFIAAYGFTDMYTAGFHPFASLEERWAYWSRNIWCNRYVATPKNTYSTLLTLLEGRDFFILTTNVDHRFQLAGLPKERLFYTQGDYGLWQCAVPCHPRTYDNHETVRRMILAQGFTIAADGALVAPERGLLMTVPGELVPHCPVCGEPMTMNLRADDTFVEDTGWHEAASRYRQFLQSHSDDRVLFLELGVGANTPVIIKYPFWRSTYANPKAVYACVNRGEALAPEQILDRSILIDTDIDAVLTALASTTSQEHRNAE